MEKSMVVAIAAVVISLVSISSSIALRPATLAPKVTTDELADGAVTGEKIASATITDANITSAGISRIAADAVGTDQIADSVITLKKLSHDAREAFENIADNSITSAKITDGTIANVDISSAAAIDLSKLATYPFGLGDLAANSVDNTKIVDGTIQTADIAAGAVTQVAENGSRTLVTTTTYWDPLPDTTITLTTGANPVLIIFSGTFSNNKAGGEVNVELNIDGTDQQQWRGGESSAIDDRFTLSFACVRNLTAGAHTIKVNWTIGAPGQTATCHSRTICAIVFKR